MRCDFILKFFNFDLPVDVEVALREPPDGVAHEALGRLVTGADALGAADQVSLFRHSSRDENATVHLGRVQGPVGYANK